jgi:hypothetical protein
MAKITYGGINDLEPNIGSALPKIVVSNPNLLSSSSTGINLGIGSWKDLAEANLCQKAIGGIYFTRKGRADETLQPGLKYDNFKSRLKSCIFKCFSWLKGSSFGG